MHRFMVFIVGIVALVLTSKFAPVLTKAAQTQSKISTVHRSQPRIGANERSHLMAITAQNAVPIMIQPDVIDVSAAGLGVAYVKSTGAISSTFGYSQMDRVLSFAKGVKVVAAYDEAFNVNIAYIGDYYNVGGTSSCIEESSHQCVFWNYMMTDSFKERVIDIALGSEHVLLLDEAGNVKTYGSAPGHNPLIPLIGKVAAISAGAQHNLFAMQNGRVRAVGDNTTCQSAQTSAGITYPDDIRDAVSVAAGPTHSLALLSNGNVVGWGCASSANASVRVPEAIPPPDIAGRVVEISASSKISAALLSDGTVRLWGSNCSLNSADRCATTNALNNVAKIIPADDADQSQNVIAWAIVMDPIITSTSATTFPINGGLLTINGEYLKNAAVYVDGRAVIPSVNTANQLVVLVPRHAIGKARVEVMGISHMTSKFEIAYSAGIPTPTASRTPTLTKSPTSTRNAVQSATATTLKTTPSVTVKSIRATTIPTRTATKKANSRP